VTVDGGTQDDVVANWEGPGACGTALAVIDATVPPSTSPGGTVYIAGAFSALGTGTPSSEDWASNLYPMDHIGADEWQILVPAVPGTTLQYKFDLNGTWSNVEETASCSSVGNRNFYFNSPGSSYVASDTVAAWEGLDGC
jgi:hypothetical protein